MIVKIGTSYNPDTEGLETYNKKAKAFAEELSKVLTNSSVYHPAIISENNFYDRTFIVLPKDLESRLNSTNAKTLLCHLAIQAKKRTINLVLISLQWSSKNYSDKRLDNLIEVHIFSECCTFELAKLFTN